MNEPTVVAVMLTRDRPEMARRAVECFRAQTYPDKQLLVWSTSANQREYFQAIGSPVAFCFAEDWRGQTVGELRNAANAHWSRNQMINLAPDIFIHWDDDDYSHPNRIAEQVELLQSSGADVVGYNEMLFWREREKPRSGDDPETRAYNHTLHPGEAWLYRNTNRSYALGTSLCYWRKTWERKPFPATSYGEDLQFCTGLKVFGVPAFGCRGEALHDPRMIARIHAGNTSTAYKPENMAKASEWRRVPSWDGYCRSIMEAK